MKNLKTATARLRGKAKLLFTSLTLFASLSTSAQLVSSISINTGYSNVTTALLPFNSQDPNWDVVNVSLPLTSGGTPYDAWISDGWTAPLGSTRWLTYEPAAGAANGRMVTVDAEVDAVGATITFIRKFENCIADSLRITGSGRADNQFVSMTVDGIAVPGLTLGFNTAINYSAMFAPGEHIIRITIENIGVAGPNNPIGLSIDADIISQTGTASIMDRDNFPDVKCAAVSGSGCKTPCTNCTTPLFVPKVTNANGDLTCSQIYDNGTTVGINTTGGFGYTAGTGVFTAGAPPTQTVRLEVRGLTRSTYFVATSDAKFKKDINILENSLGKVMKLRPVEYSWKAEEYKEREFDRLKHQGFIAQELKEVLPNTVIKDENGEYAVDYNAIIPTLTQAIQEQQKMINELKDEVARWKGENTSSATDIITPATGSTLEQNTPNPFTSETVIRYNVSSLKSEAYIGIYSIKGELLSRFNISSSGKGNVTINGGELPAGIYMYSLVIDGVKIDTKKMVLSK